MATAAVIKTPEGLVAQLGGLMRVWKKKAKRAAKKAGGFIKRVAKWAAGTTAGRFVVRNAKRAGRETRNGYLWLSDKLSGPAIYVVSAVAAYFTKPRTFALLFGMSLIATAVLTYSIWKWGWGRLEEETPPPAAQVLTTEDAVIAEVVDLANRVEDVAVDAAAVADTVAATAAAPEVRVQDTKVPLQLNGELDDSETMISRYQDLEKALKGANGERNMTSEATMRLHVISIMSGQGDGKLKSTAKPGEIYRDCKEMNMRAFPDFDWNFAVMTKAAASEAARVKKLKARPVLQPV